MSHEGFGQRFYSFRQPMWHNVGTVADREMTAMEAAEEIGANYIVRLEDVVSVSGTPLPYRAIIRPPTPDDPEAKAFGIVGREYHLVSPDELFQIWDEAVAAPVETMGAIYDGAVLFISTKLPTIDVKGDEVQSYLIVESPMIGTNHIAFLTAAEARTSYVRVICKNTLLMSRGTGAVESYRMKHDRHIAMRLKAALDGVYSRAVGRMPKHADLFNLMANKRVSADEITAYLDDIYPMPAEPDRDELQLLPTLIIERREKSFEQSRRSIERQRELITVAFEGKSMGADTPAFAGTAWGLYNATAEVEQYAGVRDIKSRATQMMDATDRSRRIERAFDAAVKLAK